MLTPHKVQVSVNCWNNRRCKMRWHKVINPRFLVNETRTISSSGNVFPRYFLRVPGGKTNFVKQHTIIIYSLRDDSDHRIPTLIFINEVLPNMNDTFKKIGSLFPSASIVVQHLSSRSWLVKQHVEWTVSSTPLEKARLNQEKRTVPLLIANLGRFVDERWMVRKKLLCFQ